MFKTHCAEAQLPLPGTLLPLHLFSTQSWDALPPKKSKTGLGQNNIQDVQKLTTVTDANPYLT